MVFVAVIKFMILEKFVNGLNQKCALLSNNMDVFTCRKINCNWGVSKGGLKS